MTATAFHLARFEAPATSLYQPESNLRFLRRKTRSGWRRRDLRLLSSALHSLPAPTKQSKPIKEREARQISSWRSFLKQGFEVSLFATYFVVFLSSLWLLG